MKEKRVRGVMVGLLLGSLVMVCTTTAKATTPPPTPCAFFGYEEASDALQVGDVVLAMDPQGVACSSFTVVTDGTYGFLYCYGDDPNTPDMDEGAIEGDPITFFINNVRQENMGIWTEGGTIQVDIGIPTLVDITPPSISNISVVDNLSRDNIFSPGTASLEDRVDISFTSNEFGTYEVIIDTDGAAGFNSATDRTYSGPAVIGSQSIAWDGTNAGGAIVPDGTYYVRIIVTDGAGNPTFTLQKYVNK